MKKDIYIIKNSVNDKVYIGQAKNTLERWMSHIYNARYENKAGKEKPQQAIHRAMMKYGIDKFHYEILDYQVENYDEREIYWIKHFNSIAPNGYNMAPGGNGTGCGSEHASAIFKDKAVLLKCISEISSSKKTFVNIARKYGCSPEVIHAVNTGERYRLDGMSYPLRDTKRRYSDEMVKQIRYSLKYEVDLTLKDIAKKYHVDASQVSEINTGKIYFVMSDTYPLRKKRKTDIPENIVDAVIIDIIKSDLSLSEIAAKHNLSRTIITGINRGTYHKRPGLNYPIRSDKDQRNKSLKKFLDIEEVRNICELLRGELSIQKIAEQYSVSPATIRNINNGACKKYRIDEYKYPIRKFH